MVNFCTGLVLVIGLFAGFTATLTSASSLRNFSPLLHSLDEDYDDFSEVPVQFMRHAYPQVNKDQMVELLLPPRKRYRNYTTLHSGFFGDFFFSVLNMSRQNYQP